MPYITKIEQEAVLPLAEQIAAQPSQIVSKTLVQNRAVSLTLFAFDQGEEIATHDSSGDAMVQILEGTAQFAVDGKIHVCKAGDVLIMPAKKPHSVYAPEAFKMLLTVIFPPGRSFNSLKTENRKSMQAVFQPACFFRFMPIKSFIPRIPHQGGPLPYS